MSGAMAGEPCKACRRVDGHKMSCPVVKGRVALSVTLSEPEPPLPDSERVPMTRAERSANSANRSRPAAYAAAVAAPRTTREVRDDE